jgi:hypothetical protein
MVNHTADECGKVIRAQRCRCGEFPQVHCHMGRGAIWLACGCGKVSEESKHIDLAIYNWNKFNTWGAE